VHIPDGMLDTRTVGVTWVAAVPALGIAVRKVRQRMSDGRLVLMAVLAGLVFALQMLNFPVAGGTSGHFAGGALAAILLGPWAAMLVLASVLIVQAFIFSDGGVTALGANILNMAVVAPLVGWFVYSLAIRISDSRISRTFGAFAAAWCSTVAAALGAAVMIWLSGAAAFAPVVGAMAFWHVFIGIGEGLVTTGLVAYILAVRPDLMSADSEVLRPRGLALSLGLLAAAAAGLSFLASSSPDGLESVAEHLGFLGRSTQATNGPLAGYVVPGIANEALAGVLAGLAGAAVTGALLYALLRGVSGRKAAGHAPQERMLAHSHASAGVHAHEHAHDDEIHDHVHHHTSDEHEHGHGSGAARIAAQASTLHRLDPRAKIVAALIVVLGVVLAPPMRPLEFALLAALLIAAATIGRLPLLWVLKRSAVVLPVAGTIALFAPLARAGSSFSVGGLVGAWSGDGWVIAWAIVSKAWLSVLVTVVLSGTTPTPQLIRGLEALKVPDVFITLFSFVYRYVDVFRTQVHSMRVALESRAPAMGRLRRWRLYGNLGGSLFVRAYDRGERIHAAMLSRGFDGTLPTTETLRLTRADALLVAIALFAAAAAALY
jgi:cobalt/nickel transport system permease protein